MKPLFTNQEYEKAKFRDRLPVICYQCGKVFQATKRHIYQAMSGHSNKKCIYCSKECVAKAHIIRITILCGNCSKEMFRLPSDLVDSKSGKLFCSISCGTIYNNHHNPSGTTISKIEGWIKEQLSKRLPDLHILYNNKSTINLELDIYIPSMKLAFELNGVYHYQPIHGLDKLYKIQDHDADRVARCAKLGIKLVVVNISYIVHFNTKDGQVVLDEILFMIKENGTRGGIRNHT